MNYLKEKRTEGNIFAVVIRDIVVSVILLTEDILAKN